MAHLTILKATPETPGSAGPILLAILAGGLGVGLLFSDPPSTGGAVFSGLVALLAIPWARARAAAGRASIAAHTSFLSRAQKAVDDSNALDQLPVVDVPISLQKNEVCHWLGDAKWYELRKQTKRVNYSGFTVSIPIMKGVRYRVGSIAPSVQSDEGLTLLDTGQLYVTNKRVFFDGRSKNTTLAYRSLVGVVTGRNSELSAVVVQVGGVLSGRVQPSGRLKITDITEATNGDFVTPLPRGRIARIERRSVWSARIHS